MIHKPTYQPGSFSQLRLFVEKAANFKEYDPNSFMFDANLNEFDANLNKFNPNPIKNDANLIEFNLNSIDTDANLNEFSLNSIEFNSNLNEPDLILIEFVSNLNEFSPLFNDFGEVSEEYEAYRLEQEFFRALEKNTLHEKLQCLIIDLKSSIEKSAATTTNKAIVCYCKSKRKFIPHKPRVITYRIRDGTHHPASITM